MKRRRKSGSGETIRSILERQERKAKLAGAVNMSETDSGWEGPADNTSPPISDQTLQKGKRTSYPLIYL